MRDEVLEASIAGPRGVRSRKEVIAGDMDVRYEVVAKETLRKARVRVDIVASLVFREVWKTLPMDKTWTYAWTVASPQ